MSFVDQVRSFYNNSCVIGIPDRGRCPSLEMLREAERADLVDIFEPDEARAKFVFSVMDNGVGIRNDQKKNLFKLFGSVQEKGPIKTKGIGLGLSISRLIVQEFGGMCQAHSARGIGSIFQASVLVGQP
jgi:K+-sensing histidine kinase KdpD